MFSGTTFLQEQQGNRPIRLTFALQEANVPVFFSYWRANRADPIPANPHPLIFQSPIDLTLQHLRWLLDNVPRTKRRLFVVSFPYPAVVGFINLANTLGWATLYDARDDWEEFQKVGQARWYIPAVEKYVIANCDLTTAVSRPLAEKLQRLSPDRTIQVNPNALDPKFLQLRQTFPQSKRNSQPTIGYFGHLTPSWFDWDGLKALALFAPEWRFEIIGHHAPQDLQLPANVQYLGPKSHAEIAQSAASWSAAIIPFRLGPLADAVDPIKIYEYLALGLPVVSCRMPQIRDYPYVWTAETPSQFLQCLKEALAISFDQDAVDRWLSQNLWSTRANDFLRWTDTILSTPDPLKSLHL
jgi:glycosyltransferase involved in cell wall biosynthesis